jgi:hypothetical protein
MAAVTSPSASDTHRSGAMTVFRLVQALIALIIAACVVVQLALILTGGADANSGDSGTATPVVDRLVRLFSYFTIQSNLLVLVTAAVLAIDPWRDGPIWRVVRFDALLGILITGLVYDLILAPQVHLEGVAQLLTVGLHYVSPWLTIGAWLVFGPRPRFGRRTVVAGFVWPLAWIGYTFVHGALTDWYPYPFLDVTELGLAEALRNAGLVLLVGAAFAIVFQALDDRLPGLLRRTPQGTQPASD